MSKKLMRYLAGAALLSISGVALAQSSSCPSALSQYTSYVNSGNTAAAQQVVANHPQCFGGSGSSQATISATSVAQSNAVSNALSNRLLPAGGPASLASVDIAGMAAGAALDKWNVWGNLTNNTTKVSYTNQAATNTRNDNDILTTVLGADYALASNMVVGLSASFDRGDGSGSTAAAAPDNFSSRGYLLAPYFGMQLTKDLALDASVGFGSGKLDVASGPQSEADRLFGAVNLSYSQWFQSLQVTGKVGFLHAEEDYGDSRNQNGTVNANTKNKNTLNQFRAGAQVGYWMNGFMPYAGLSYATDHRSVSNQAMASDPIGKNAFQWTLGVNFFSLPNKLTGGVAYSQESGRTNSKNEILMANINIRF